MKPITPSEIKELKRIGTELRAAAITITRLESELDSFLNRHGAFDKGSISPRLWEKVGRIKDVAERLELHAV